jgi:Putative Actinobacterial Holin-X, holin superfamily III
MAAGRPGLVMQLRLIVAGVLRLVQSLVALSAAEFKANAGALRGALLLLVVALGLLLTALTLLTVALVLALATLVGPVVASLIVAGVAGIAGLALGRHGLARLEQTNLAPQRSIATLQAQIDRITGDAVKPAPATQAERAHDDHERHD